jgi:hypothetical protein
MNDDRLTGLLGSLRNERIDRIADDKIRTRLENAWATRMQRRSFGFRLRRFAPILATIGLFAGLGGATMNAAGDSPLYGIRTAVEDAAVVFHGNPADRAEYLISLLDQRQDEAARLESTGNALAASKVRESEQRTLKALTGLVPEAPDTTVVEPLPSPTETPTPSPTATPSPSPSPTPLPTPQLTPPPTPRTATPVPSTPRPTTTVATPSRTPTPPASTPPPTPTPSAMVVQLTGYVRNPDLSIAVGACVSYVAPTTANNFECTSNTYMTATGAYRLTVSARLNQTVTVYAWMKDATGTMLKGYAMMTVKGTTVLMPDIKLAKV